MNMLITNTLKHLLINLFDLEKDNSKIGHSVSVNHNGNRMSIGSPDSNLHTGNTLSSGRCNVFDYKKYLHS